MLLRCPQCLGLGGPHHLYLNTHTCVDCGYQGTTQEFEITTYLLKQLGTDYVVRHRSRTHIELITNQGRRSVQGARALEVLQLHHKEA